jgi:outer membrane protein, multidrug efflux system
MKSSLFFVLGAWSASTAIGSPDFSVTYRDVPAGYSDAWTTAVPADALARGEWWKLFDDPVLDDLVVHALAANQDLRAAVARVEQARAAAGTARSAYWPQLAMNGTIAREQASRTTDITFPDTRTTTYAVPLAVAWELDFFGRVRRLSESARADAEASAATFESLRLALTADVAMNYFSVRAVDRELSLIRETIALRRRSLDLVNARVRGGAATDLDLARAEAELASVETEAAAVANRRAALQNAIAVLTGEPAPAFRLPTSNDRPSAAPAAPPAVPAGLPAELLERRPDIAAAERALAGASARIGVAKAAFFPAISLTGAGGYASGEIDSLFKADSRIWSVGPSLYLPIFQGGRIRANLARSRAAYEESVAMFRQQVLVAFREVQDALTATRLLAEEAAAQERALAAARRAAALAQTRYAAGLVSYFEVIDAQRTSLAMERASAQLAAQRFNTSVALIKALGGGWGQPMTTVAAR